MVRSGGWGWGWGDNNAIKPLASCPFINSLGRWWMKAKKCHFKFLSWNPLGQRPQQIAFQFGFSNGDINSVLWTLQLGHHKHDEVQAFAGRSYRSLYVHNEERSKTISLCLVLSNCSTLCIPTAHPSTLATSSYHWCSNEANFFTDLILMNYTISYIYLFVCGSCLFVCSHICVFVHLCVWVNVM